MEKTAGSAPTFFAMIGMRPPTVAAIMHTDSRRRPMTRPIATLVDEPGDDEAQCTEHRSQQRTDPQLPPDDPAEIADAHLADGQSAGDRGRGLVAGVAAGSGQQRDEEGEDDDLIEAVLIDLEDLDGQDRRHGEDEQPHDVRLRTRRMIVEDRYDRSQRFGTGTRGRSPRHLPRR